MTCPKEPWAASLSRTPCFPRVTTECSEDLIYLHNTVLKNAPRIAAFATHGLELLMNRMRAAGASTGLVGLVLIAFIAASPGGCGLITHALAAAPLSDWDLRSHLQAQGYSDIQNLRHEGRRVVVTATKDGQTSEFVVDSATGKAARSTDDDDDD